MSPHELAALRLAIGRVVKAELANAWKDKSPPGLRPGIERELTVARAKLELLLKEKKPCG